MSGRYGSREGQEAAYRELDRLAERLESAARNCTAPEHGRMPEGDVRPFSLPDRYIYRSHVGSWSVRGADRDVR
ncbi:hypothetical protein [Streptomyces gardneri]|uniref:hypothetical protein n=1 Tax=Streptomyces gardneri TaxID=66892 RepID=UPI0035E196B5